MGLESTLRTVHGKGVKPKTNNDDFNEAIYDGWKKAGWDWDEAAGTISTLSGRVVPEVARVTPTKLYVMGYESDCPEDHAFMYAAFNKNFAQVVADNISEGYLILAHSIEGRIDEYYLVQPGKVDKINTLDLIVGAYGLKK